MTIIAAATKYGDVISFIPAPARHSDVEQALYKSHGKPNLKVKKQQGFIDDRGNFLNRRDAYVHARECEQNWTRRPGPENYQGPELFSEDVWESGDRFVSPYTKIKKCRICGTTENLFEDYESYRCHSSFCVPY